jgi:hypothetical protein
MENERIANIFSGDEDNGDRDAFIDNDHHSPREEDDNKYLEQEDEEMKAKQV